MSNPVFGIDLGTTYSCIAYVDEYNRPTVVPNLAGDLTTPSVVRFDEGERVVGEEAKQASLIYPDETVSMVKRHIGKQSFFFFYDDKQISAEEVSSYIVKKAVNDASSYTGYDIKDVVITCPAYFGIPEREATKLAGELAGLNVLEIINEPTAAAICYGLLEKANQTVLVYDLGGGTFDVSIVQIVDGGSRILATGGDDELGGKDWDAAIVEFFVSEWKEQTGSNSDPNDSLETIQDFYIKAENAKQRLTNLAKTDVMIVHDAQRAKVTLTREKFDELTEGLLRRTIELTNLVIEEAIDGERISSADDIQQILLVGGSTKMPQVMSMLDENFPNMEKQLFKPDEAVALGAAVYGQKLQIGQAILDEIPEDEIKRVAEASGKDVEDITADDIPEETREKAQETVANEMGLELGYVGEVSKTTIENVTSRSFGIIAYSPQLGKNVVSNLIRKNDTLPATNTQSFGTQENNQPQADLRIVENLDVSALLEDFYVEGEAETGGVSVRELGLAVMHLPPNTPKQTEITVKFTLNAQGLLRMKAINKASEEEIETEIQTEGSISEAEIEEIKESVRGVSIL